MDYYDLEATTSELLRQLKWRAADVAYDPTDDEMYQSIISIMQELQKRNSSS